MVSDYSFVKDQEPGLFRGRAFFICLYDLLESGVIGALPMTYRGHVKDGQIALNEPARLPEGAEVNVEVVEKVRIVEPAKREPLGQFQPIEMPGGSLADELIRDRR
jgi:hypothetical protein